MFDNDIFLTVSVIIVNSIILSSRLISVLPSKADTLIDMVNSMFASILVEELIPGLAQQCLLNYK